MGDEAGGGEGDGEDREVGEQRGGREPPLPQRFIFSRKEKAVCYILKRFKMYLGQLEASTDV